MQVGPEDAAVNKPGRLQEMVVVVPVDADKDKTERIAQKDRDQRAQRIEADTVRRLHFEHHDGDDDRYHAITECFQSPFTHPSFSCAGPFGRATFALSGRRARKEARSPWPRSPAANRRAKRGLRAVRWSLRPPGPGRTDDFPGHPFGCRLTSDGRGHFSSIFLTVCKPA